jgi:hypothetical protein
MTDSIRLNKTTIKETITSENSTKPAAQQTQTQTGIASAKDSFQAKQDNSLFTLNRDTGELKFGDGVSGSRPPIGNSAQLLYHAKSEISGYLKGDANTNFPAMKNYLLGAQNQQIDAQLKEAGEKAQIAMNQANTGMATGIVGGLITIGTAVNNLRDAASQAKSEASNNPALEARYNHFASALNDLAVETQSESKKLQQKANQQDVQTKKVENQEQKDDDWAKESKSHSDNIRDAILDFLRKLDDIKGTF